MLMNLREFLYVVWPLILRFDVSILVLSLWTSLNKVYKLVRMIG